MLCLIRFYSYAYLISLSRRLCYDHTTMIRKKFPKQSGDVMLTESKTKVKILSSKISENVRSLRYLNMGIEGEMRG